MQSQKQAQEIPPTLSIDLSIIIPCYNVEVYVEQCLDSIINQCVEGVELIVIDDASTDGTWDRLVKYGDLPFVNLLRLVKNTGLGAVRNRGIELSRGEFLLFLDSDDWLDEETIAELIRSLKKNPADITIFSYARVYEKLGTFSAPNEGLFESVPSQVTNHEDKILLLDFPTMAWFKLYRREFVIDSGIVFGEGYYEDVSWTYPLTILAKKIQMLPEVLYCYRQRKGSILNRKNIRHLDLVTEYDKVFSHCEALGDGDYRKKIIAKAVGHYVFILFIRSDRLSWSDMKKFYVKAHEQLSQFDRTEIDEAIAGLPASPIKSKVLMSGSLMAYFFVFGMVKVSRFIKLPFHLYKAYSSGSRSPVVVDHSS